MLTEKITPLQIRRIERARRNEWCEKKRIAATSTHRSDYRWSSDPRHEQRAENIRAKKDRFWERINAIESEATYDIKEIVERELKAEAELEKAKQLKAKKRMEAIELAMCLEKSFDSEEFIEKLMEDMEDVE